jgi:hypothetical protein
MKFAVSFKLFWFIGFHFIYDYMFCKLLFNFVRYLFFFVMFMYSYRYVYSALGTAFHCVVLCIVCV